MAATDIARMNPPLPEPSFALVECRADRSLCPVGLGAVYSNSATATFRQRRVTRLESVCERSSDYSTCPAQYFLLSCQVDSMGTQDIYVISDLHLGGAPQSGDRPSFQMCPPESRRRLARFIHRLRRRAPGNSTPLELIINGDFVDFLAEQPFAAFTTSAAVAVEKLRRIITTADEGAPDAEQLFPALRAFVAQGHRLTVLLGNHDIELTLAPVRHELLHQLTGGRPAQVEFMFDGEACRRGSVLLEHGNRYDGWNAVAHGALRAFRARASRGEPEYAFPSPAGSRLVTEVMTPLKGLY